MRALGIRMTQRKDKYGREIIRMIPLDQCGPYIQSLMKALADEYTGEPVIFYDSASGRGVAVQVIPKQDLDLIPIASFDNAS